MLRAYNCAAEKLLLTVRRGALVRSRADDSNAMEVYVFFVVI